jgi:hypothetical protein
MWKMSMEQGHMRNKNRGRRMAMFAAVSLVALTTTFAMSGRAWAEADIPFEITVDGQQVTGSTLPPNAQTAPKGTLDIQVKFDGLGVNPILNVSTAPPRASYKIGDTIRFLASLNYSQWVDHAELRIYEAGNRTPTGMFQVMDVGHDGAVEWVMPDNAPKHMEYVLRVYDGEGRYDETVPLPLNVTSLDTEAEADDARAVAPGYSDDRTAVRNIDISGGAVTIYGKNVPEGHEVKVAGELVPVDPDGSFVVQRIYPVGPQHVEVTIKQDGKGLDFSRDIDIPKTEWFYVGLADFTAGYRWGGKVEEARTGEFSNKAYTRGHMAFYLKGKIKGQYILTAAADTGEQRLKSLFKGLDEKDPQQFLKRIDPDDYYPVYGDDSTSVEDAPTKGKFYVRLDRGLSHVMWGNFKADITGSKLLSNQRALYGASAVYRSPQPAPDGGAKTKVDVYAALPGTLPQTDSFLGTGGSAYFLKHQDVTPGSETLSIERRNAVTGWVVSRTTLKYGTDYDLDYVQGVTILRTPLSSSDSIGAQNYLVAHYEYTPVASDVHGYVVGGRAQQWVGDNVRLGATAMREKTGGADQKMYGADVHIQKSEGTYVEAEVARTEGPGIGTTYSPDGGLTLQDNASVGTAGKKAEAYRVEGHVALEDLSDGALKGKMAARYEHYDKGFSSLDVQAPDKKRLYGAEADIKVSDTVTIKAEYSDSKTGDGRAEREAIGSISTAVDDHITVETYADAVRKVPGGTAAATTPNTAGTRVNTGVKLIYAWDDDEQAYVYAHGTVKRTGNMQRDNRVGVGEKMRLSDKVTAEGETSYGNQGLGALFSLNYEPTVDDRYTIGYQLDPSRDTASGWPFTLVGEDLGKIMGSAHHRFNEQWSAFGEDNMDLFGKRRSLTQVYGVTYTPDERWTAEAAAEIGNVFDRSIDPVTFKKNPDIARKAVSLAVGYKEEDGIDGRIKGEARRDTSEDSTRNLSSYLLQASLAGQTSKNWRAVANLDAVFTTATSSAKKGAYVEGSLGYAYRPIDNDRVNALMKFTYLYDNPGANQVTVDGTTSSAAQRSYIFSGDVNYDIIPQLTLGAKYGMRIGETRERIVGARWTNSQVHLGVLRADLHLVHELDALLEGRVLWSPTTGQRDVGAIAAIYRHMGENLKVGIGYNFGHFSDDLRDLSFNDQGVFLNVIGKF